MTRHSCRICGSIWSGLARAHCTGCHKTFGGIHGFEMHRKGFKCVDPKSIGLIEKDNIWVQQYERIKQND